MRLFDNELRLVILDVDGVILDHREALPAIMKETARDLNLPHAHVGGYFLKIRNGERMAAMTVSAQIRELWPGQSDLCYQQVMKRFNELESKSPYPLIPDSLEAIDWLRDRDIAVALCTNRLSWNLQAHLEAHGVDMIKFMHISTRDNGFLKPDPRAISSILQITSVDRKKAAFVGDWYPDMETARGADVRFIAVLSGGIPRHAFLREGVENSHIIERLANFPELIEA